MMKSARPQNSEASAAVTSAIVSKFTGTDNPRHLRALALLKQRPAPRGELDQRAGCANSPELVAELRRRGLEVPCERVDALDRDGRPCRPGVYRLSAADRAKVRAWLRERSR
jgi:hypothetical protein